MDKVADSRTRIKVKNIHTGVSFEFSTLINSARFVGTTDNVMRYEVRNKEARVFCIDGEEYVFVYDEEERPIMQEYKRHPPLAKGLIEVVSSTGERTPLYSYLSAARHLGLLIRHVMEEERRGEKRELASRYVIGKKVYTIEFGGERRKMSQSKGIRCHWKGIYDREGDWEKIHRINVTR